MNDNEELLSQLVSKALLRDGDYGLASGQRSPYYVECGRALSDPEILINAAIAMGLLIRPSVHAVGGMTMGADPLAIALSLGTFLGDRPLRWFSVRGSAKRGRYVEGFCDSGQEVAVIEDVLTSGGSAMEAIRAVRHEGMVVSQVITLVSRDPSIQTLDGVPVSHVFTLDQLLRAG